jgi:23S rRNA pseudouridine1911/1915/1917 synthase
MIEHDIVVPPDLGGERADKVIATSLGLARSDSRAIIDRGEATVDEHPVSPSDRLGPGTIVHVVIAHIDRTIEADRTVEFTVLFEDQHLIVVDKPIGVVTHPTSDRSRGTLVHGVLDRYPDVRGVGQEGRWGIVHRLDRDTSGLLVIARTHDAYAELVAMMKRRAIARRYLAMVIGAFDNTRGTIDAPIGRDPRQPTRMRVDRSGKQARTHYRRLAAWDTPERTLLSVGLETGRTHQIRVHFGAIDHPIVGDTAYGRSSTVDSPGRPWLHARELSFVHPVTGEAIDVVSPLPADLTDSLGSLGAPKVGAPDDIDGSPL